MEKVTSHLDQTGANPFPKWKYLRASSSPLCLAWLRSLNLLVPRSPALTALPSAQLFPLGKHFPNPQPLAGRQLTPTKNRASHQKPEKGSPSLASPPPLRLRSALRPLRQKENRRGPPVPE